MRKIKSKGGRPRIEGDLRKSLRVRERNITSREKVLKNAVRLHFPEKKPREKMGVYRVRKFLYFCEHYARHISGRYAHQPVRLMKWQLEIIEHLLGDLDQKGYRKYRRFFLHVARKNGKTFLVCLLILYWLAEESFNDPSAEIVSCAATREQSIRVIFNTVRRMVEISLELSRLIQVRRQPPILTNVITNSTYEPLASDAKPQLGKNISLCIFDESHAQPNSELWDAMATSQSMREQPLFVSISTSGDSRSSFYYQIYERMKEIENDPSIDPGTLVRIFEVSEYLDWKDPANFHLANPALGDAGEKGFRDKGEMIRELQKALQEEGEGAFRQFYLNQFAQYGQLSLVTPAQWDQCGDPVDYASLPGGRSCFVGLDLSSTTDLTAISLIFEPREDGQPWDVLTWGWLGGENLSEVCRRDRLPYDRWLRNGNILFEGRPVIDIKSVRGKLNELAGRYRFKHIGFDPYLESEIKDWSEFELIPVAQQSKSLSPATKRLKELILNRKIRHGGDPFLRAMVENARVETDPNGNIRLSKKTSRSRIDPLAALVNAVYLSMNVPDDGEFHSIYETRGIVYLDDPPDGPERPSPSSQEGGESKCPRCAFIIPKDAGNCLNCGRLKM